MTQFGDASKGTSLLLILDGWGYREEQSDNAIAQAHTPVWDHLWRHAPHTLLSCAGEAVGLPPGQMGSSEVGHMNLGAGRVVRQELTQISKAIADDGLAANTVLSEMMSSVADKGVTLHVLGLMSPGGVHSHEDHIFELVKMAVAQGVNKILVHAFLDGRDTPPRSAQASLDAMEAWCQRLSSKSQQVMIASLCGRYFAMDRDQRWQRTQQAYEMLVSGQASRYAKDALAGLEAAYVADESDEFVQPTVIDAAESCCVTDGDAVVFMNFRGDRARQLSRAFIDKEFSGFARSKVPELAYFTALTCYADDLQMQVAFPPQQLNNTIGEYVASLNKKQLRIAETEKYAHVTFFFSGGQEALWPGEERMLIPSPHVATYDLKPQMSVQKVTDQLVKAIKEQKFDLIICNFANSDMVGHTGILSAAVQAVEAVDVCIGRILQAIKSSSKPSQCLITADHGNAEQMRDAATNQPHTAHTSSDVPLVYVGSQSVRFATQGRLADVSPTLLDLMGLPVPQEMTGRSLALHD